MNVSIIGHEFGADLVQVYLGKAKVPRVGVASLGDWMKQQPIVLVDAILKPICECFCWKNSFPQAVLPLFVLSIEAWTEFSSCLVSGLQLQNIYEGLILSPCSCQYRIRCNWFRSWPLPLLEANVTASLMEAKDRRRRGVTSHEKCCNESEPPMNHTETCP